MFARSWYDEEELDIIDRLARLDEIISTLTNQEFVADVEEPFEGRIHEMEVKLKTLKVSPIKYKNIA